MMKITIKLTAMFSIPQSFIWLLSRQSRDELRSSAHSKTSFVYACGRFMNRPLLTKPLLFWTVGTPVPTVEKCDERGREYEKKLTAI